MTGFVHNVLGGAVRKVESIFDPIFHTLLGLFSPVASSVSAAFQANATADFASFMVDVGEAVNSGKSGNDLLLAIESAAEKQGVKLGGQVLAAFAGSVEFSFGPKAAAPEAPLPPVPETAPAGAV